MYPDYTPQDHERIANSCIKIIHDNDLMTDGEFGILVTHLLLNVIMRVPKEKRQLVLVKIMSTIKKAIVNHEIK